MDDLTTRIKKLMHSDQELQIRLSPGTLLAISTAIGFYIDSYKGSHLKPELGQLMAFIYDVLDDIDPGFQETVKKEREAREKKTKKKGGTAYRII